MSVGDKSVSVSVGVSVKLQSLHVTAALVPVLVGTSTIVSVDAGGSTDICGCHSHLMATGVMALLLASLVMAVFVLRLSGQLPCLRLLWKRLCLLCQGNTGTSGLISTDNTETVLLLVDIRAVLLSVGVRTAVSASVRQHWCQLVSGNTGVSWCQDSSVCGRQRLRRPHIDNG